ncbi:glycosyl hydrolase [Actinoplanes sp. NPDC049599]|uniref:glycosyl hydrolase n=1 Tax=Actinoplanes sp. NPDC049599 TaxID=3363903 RepID=UPI00378B9AB7
MTWQHLRRSRLGRSVLIVASLLAVLTAGLAAVPTARAGSGTAVVGAAGRCLDVTWSQTGNGTPVQLYDCNGTGAQNWTVPDNQGPVRALGKCLDVAGASSADGTPVQLFDCNGTGAQQWRLADKRLINTGSGKCLDAHGGSGSGTPLQLWACADSATQAWSVPAPAVKKGVSTWAFPRLADSIRDVRAGWYYDWSAGNEDVPAQAEFVPMIWGAAAVNDADLATARRSGTTLLGFNEPDLHDQANLTVEQALALWPRLEQTGARLGSPAVAFGGDTPGGWLDRFLTGTRERRLRVDFITVHWYGSDFGEAAADQFLGYVQAVHDRYGLPVWVTEFGLINFTGTPRYPTPDQLTTFITKSTAGLEAAPYVERYAWFALPATGDSTAYGLYREDGTPTAAGQAYRNAGTVPNGVPDDGPEQRMIDLINEERARAGCPAVTRSDPLTKAARAHSRLMADRADLTHRFPDEPDLGDRITAAGYRWAALAENITSGAFRTPETAMYGRHDATTNFVGFMESEGHRANILNCGLREVGVGVARDRTGAPWWTQDFGKPV